MRYAKDMHEHADLCWESPFQIFSTIPQPLCRLQMTDDSSSEMAPSWKIDR